MQRFYLWMKQLEDKPGMNIGSISFFIRSQETVESCTLLLRKEGVSLKKAGLKQADLLITMTKETLEAWLDGTLDPKQTPNAIAFDGNIRLFRELGQRMKYLQNNASSILALQTKGWGS